MYSCGNYDCKNYLKFFFGLSWLGNHTWLGECLTLFSLTHKDLVQKNLFKKYSQCMVKRYLKKCIHISKLNLKWYSICSRYKFSSIIILYISISDEHWVIMSVYEHTYSWSFRSLRIWEITSLLPSSRGTRLCTNTLTSLVHYH